MDIAAAAVKMAHAAAAGDGDDREIPREPAHARRPDPGVVVQMLAPAGRANLPAPTAPIGGTPGDDARRARACGCSLAQGGWRAFVRRNLVGAVTGEAGVPSSVLGQIEIADRFSLVEVPEALADEIISALKATTIRGKKVFVRRERDTRSSASEE